MAVIFSIEEIPTEEGWYWAWGEDGEACIYRFDGKRFEEGDLSHTPSEFMRIFDVKYFRKVSSMGVGYHPSCLAVDERVSDLEAENKKLRELLAAQFSDPKSANAVINNELVLNTTPEEYVDQLLRGDLMEGER